MFGMRKKHPNLCTADDARFFLLLCFGREPEHPSELSRREGSKPFAVLKTLLKSPEFIRGVLEPLQLGKRLAWLPYSEAQISLLIAGAKRHFSHILKPKDCESRTSILKALLPAERFLKAFDAADTGYRTTWFINQLENIRPHSGGAATGRIETLSVTECSGYAFDTRQPGLCLQLDFYINGTFVGTSKADGVRREIEDANPGFATTGFRHTIQLPSHLSAHSHLVLAVFDHATGVAVCPPREFANMGSRRQHPILSLKAAVEAAQLETRGAVKDALKTIDDLLPALIDYAAFPLERYTEHRTLYRAEIAPGILGNSTSPTVTIVRQGDELADQTADILVFTEDRDSLTENALQWVRYAAAQNPEASVFFADYDVCSSPGTKAHPIYRTPFDVDYFLQRPQETTAYAVRRAHLEALGGFAKAEKEAMHFGLWLRILNAYGEAAFCHIPHILWHKTGTANLCIENAAQEPSTAHGAPSDEIKTAEKNRTASKTAAFIRAANMHFLARSPRAIASPHLDSYGGDLDDCMRTTWPLDPTMPKLAIIIPMRDGLDLTRACVESLRHTLDHPGATEILIVDNGSQQLATKDWLKWADGMDGITVMLHSEPFNWSEINNRAAHATDADYLLFLNNDTVALDKGWDSVLRGYLHRADVGAVGARLFFEDGTLQFAGYVVNPETIAFKEAYGESPCRGGYNNRSQLTHRCSALIGAFLACRRDVFEQAGGFDADLLPVAFNDIDFCLSLRSKGLKILYVPALNFQHLESKSRGYDALSDAKARRVKQEQAIMVQKWGDQLKHDPWYTKAFIKAEPTHSLLATPNKRSITSQ